MPSADRSTINLQEIFNLIDRNGRGSIEIQKIGALLRYAGMNPTERACSQIIGSHRQFCKEVSYCSIPCREGEQDAHNYD